MSIFGSIMSKIFGTEAKAAAPGTASPAGTAGASAHSASGGASASAGSAAAGSISGVDVEANLNALATKSGQPSNWRTSIVDLMKLLDLDSSLTARKELAKELHYTGSTDDSASMNIWLHKQVMTKLAENGGKVPAELKHA